MYSIYAGDELLYSDVCPLETRKVTSPTLKMGVDEAGSLEFTVSEVNKCYTKLLRMKTIITVKKFNPTLGQDGDEEAIWDGRILREDRDFNKNKRLYVEGALAFLNDSCQPLKEYQNKSLEDLVTAILKEHSNIVKDDARKLYWGGKAASFNPPELEYWSTAYEYTIDSIKNLAEYLECHFIVKKDTTDGKNKIYFFKDEYSYSKQSIVFGNNLMDYTENYDLSKMATVLLPLCQTDRETADAPRIVGTDVDLSTPKIYTDNDHYGVLLPLTNNTVCRKQLTTENRTYDNVPIPPHRNCLNVILKDVDEEAHTYKFDKPDFLGSWVNDGTYVIPEYVKVWRCNNNPARVDNIDDARASTIDPAPITNVRTYFDFVSNDRFFIVNDSPARMELVAEYSKNSTKDGTVWLDYEHQDLLSQAEKYRTFRERALMDYDSIMENYGILASRTGYQTAIVEIDASYFKTIYISSNGPVYSGDFRALTLWKKSSSFDENSSYVRHVPLMYPEKQVPEPYIFASYTTDHGIGLFFYPTYCVTVGYELQSQDDTYTVGDLVQNSSISPWVLNHDKYTIAKEFEVDYCFEKKIDLNYPPAGSTFESLGESPHMLLILSGTTGSLGLTLVSDDDKNEDTTITIGINTEGVDLSERYPYREYKPDHTEWIPNAPGSFAPDYIYADDTIPEEYKLRKYYGVLTKITQGVQLPDKTQMDTIGPNPHFNIWNDGAIDLQQLRDIAIIKESLSDEYRCCVFVTKASYEDPSGRKYPNSIYLTAQMQGKSMIYCIFEFTDGHDGNGVWDVDVTTPDHLPHPVHGLHMHEDREYGKYINGLTKLEAKKITMPYSKTQNRLVFVVICSYGSDPMVWIHDPKLANKMQYLTVASANDGNVKIRSDSSNRFLSGLEYGDLDQNGTNSYVLSNTILRSKEYIPIKANGDYLLAYDGTNVQAKAYIYDFYDEDDATHGYSLCTEYDTPNPFILLPYMYEGYEVRFVFKKADNSSINSTDIRNIMLYSEPSSKNMLFTQGKMVYTTDPLTDIVTISIENDQSGDENYVTTVDFYKITSRKCTLLARIDLNRLALPTIYASDRDHTYIIKDYIPIITTWSQTPTLVTDPSTSAVSIVYKNVIQHIDIDTGMVQISAKENEQYRFQVKLQITYEDENQETQFVYIPIEPNYVRTFSVLQLVDAVKEFVPASNAYETYGHIEKRIEFEDAESSQELLERAKKYLRQSQFDEMQLKVKALDMTVMGANVDNLRIADKINVSSPPHGVYRDFIIRTMSIPFDKPEDTTFELGWDNKDSLAKLIRKEKSKW